MLQVLLFRPPLQALIRRVYNAADDDALEVGLAGKHSLTVATEEVAREAREVAPKKAFSWSDVEVAHSAHMHSRPTCARASHSQVHIASLSCPHHAVGHAIVVRVW